MNAFRVANFAVGTLSVMLPTVQGISISLKFMGMMKTPKIGPGVTESFIATAEGQQLGGRSSYPVACRGVLDFTKNFEFNISIKIQWVAGFIAAHRWSVARTI